MRGNACSGPDNSRRRGCPPFSFHDRCHMAFGRGRVCRAIALQSVADQMRDVTPVAPVDVPRRETATHRRFSRPPKQTGHWRPPSQSQSHQREPGITESDRAHSWFLLSFGGDES